VISRGRVDSETRRRHSVMTVCDHPVNMLIISSTRGLWLDRNQRRRQRSQLLLNKFGKSSAYALSTVAFAAPRSPASSAFILPIR